MGSDRDFKARQRAMFGAAAARVGRELRRAPTQARQAVNAAGAAEPDKEDLTSDQRSPTMRSAREDKVRGRIDKIAGRVLEAIGRLTGNRSTVLKGKAARGRGTGRLVKGRLKRVGR
jgi:uncharacterized protein YjbJ (UPF0337 family)